MLFNRTAAKNKINKIFVSAGATRNRDLKIMVSSEAPGVKS